MQELDCYPRIQFQQPLITPAALKQQLPLLSNIFRTIQHIRHEATQIIQGKDDRLLVIVGPCSIHDTNAALEYAELLSKAISTYSNELVILMRTYFEKPRTTIGWKGLISDPYLNNSFDINTGLQLSRQLLLDINALGVPAATEFLDTIIPQYLSDLISWCAIGARTSESQTHRELASGMAMPIGFKNTTDGKIQAAIDAVMVASHPHHFISIDEKGFPCVVSTTGNNACHIVLRGSNHKSNYSAPHIQDAITALNDANITSRIMIDCSHGNSRKEHQRQITVAHSLAEQIRSGCTAICGIMLESHLVAGKQQLTQSEMLRYGQSITDGCIAWEDTIPVLDELAEAVKIRRSSVK